MKQGALNLQCTIDTVPESNLCTFLTHFYMIWKAEIFDSCCKTLLSLFLGGREKDSVSSQLMVITHVNLLFCSTVEPPNTALPLTASTNNTANFKVPNPNRIFEVINEIVYIARYSANFVVNAWFSHIIIMICCR